MTETRRRWTRAEDNLLRDMLDAGLAVEEIARRLSRTALAIYSRVQYIDRKRRKPTVASQILLNQSDRLPMGLLCAGCAKPVSIDIVKGMCQACYARERRARHREAHDAVCKICGTRFTGARRDTRFCSSPCRQKANRLRISD
jgi:hypothetical protein